jgi:penicillin-binding protein 2
VVLGGVSAHWAEGNRIEIKRIPADRGIIVDAKGKVLARNTLNPEGKLIREYPFKGALSHVIGYVGEVSDRELTDSNEALGIRMGSITGKMGVERKVDTILRGTEGEELVEVNASGEIERVIGRKEPVLGREVTLSIDSGLSSQIVEIFKKREIEKEKPLKGSVVVSNVKTGNITAMVSWPTFDANLFSGISSDENYKTAQDVISDNDNKPMFNRAISGAYAPGSIYKLVTAVSGLEEGKIDEETEVEDTGEIKVGEYRFGTWNFDQNGKTEGNVNIVKAIARSNDIFFYKVGEWLGVENMRKWSKKLGLGEKTGVDLSGETSGMIPDPIEKERNTGERWFLGNTYHMSIGQGDILTTPLQMNRLTAAVVGGKLCQPKVIKKMGEVEDGSKCEDLGISKESREIIYRGMLAACSSGGTAFPFFDFSVPTICKTGTAQHGGEKDDPHAWISVVIPKKSDGEYGIGNYEDGYVVTVMLEAAGEGSYEAGPIARSVADYMIKEMN